MCGRNLETDLFPFNKHLRDLRPQSEEDTFSITHKGFFKALLGEIHDEILPFPGWGIT